MPPSKLNWRPDFHLSNAVLNTLCLYKSRSIRAGSTGSREDAATLPAAPSKIVLTDRNDSARMPDFGFGGA
jgi:hypothetical protein